MKIPFTKIEILEAKNELIKKILLKMRMLDQ